MSQHRDFDAARRERQLEQLTFTVGGDTFTIDASLPAGVLLDLGRYTASSDSQQAFAAFVGFWDEVIPPDDQERFAQAVRRVDLDTMIAMVEWIVEESTGRPLGRRSSSPEAPSTDGQPSRVVSLSPARGVRSA